MCMISEKKDISWKHIHSRSHRTADMGRYNFCLLVIGVLMCSFCCSVVADRGILNKIYFHGGTEWHASAEYLDYMCTLRLFALFFSCDNYPVFIMSAACVKRDSRRSVVCESHFYSFCLSVQSSFRASDAADADRCSSTFLAARWQLHPRTWCFHSFEMRKTVWAQTCIWNNGRNPTDEERENNREETSVNERRWFTSSRRIKKKLLFCLWFKCWKVQMKTFLSSLFFSLSIFLNSSGLFVSSPFPLVWLFFLQKTLISRPLSDHKNVLCPSIVDCLRQRSIISRCS